MKGAHECIFVKYIMPVNMLKKKRNIWLEYLLIYLALYSMAFIRHYQTDTYSALTSNGTFGHDQGQLLMGRYGCYAAHAILDIILGVLNIGYYEIFHICILMIIASIAIVSGIIEKKVIEVTQQDSSIGIRLCILLIFTNVFFQSWFDFWECAPQWSGALLCIGAAIWLFDVKNWKKSSLCLLLLISSLSFYQGTIALFIIIELFLIFLENKGILNKESFWSSVYCVFMAGIACVISYVIVRITPYLLGTDNQSRRAGSIGMADVINNVSNIIEYVKDILIDTYEMLPKYFLLFIVGMLIIVLFINYWNQNKRMNTYLYIFLVLFCALASAFIPHFVATNTYIPPRSITTFWTWVSILALLVLTNVRKKALELVVTGAMFVLLIANVFVINNIFTETIATNRMDQEIAYSIQNEIEKYEDSNKITVEIICTYFDEDTTNEYEFVTYKGYDINRRMYSAEWSLGPGINFYNNTSYMYWPGATEDYTKWFDDKEWDYFLPEEQLRFENNVLHLAVY